MTKSPDPEMTHFGFKRILKSKKAAAVSDVFDSVASRYDVMNDLMSMGIHRLWKRFTVELSGVRAGHQVLDIAGGTGDLAMKFADRVGATGRVMLADINDAMLTVGRSRLIDQGYSNTIDFVQTDAQDLPFADDLFHCVCIGFGLRNVTDKSRALAAMARVLRPGGRLLVLEFSTPVNPVLSKLYDVYSFAALPRMGRWVTGDAESYQYLAESIRMHPNQDTLKNMMEGAGLVSCQYHNMTGGIVAVHSGIKP